MILGYARVSTEDQHLDAQLAALEAAGAGRVFAEKISGTDNTRPELERLIDQLRPGDVVVVTKYDRLSRSPQACSGSSAVSRRLGGWAAPRPVARAEDRGPPPARRRPPQHRRARAAAPGQPEHHPPGLIFSREGDRVSHPW